MPANWHLKKEVTLGIIWSVLGGLAEDTTKET